MEPACISITKKVLPAVRASVAEVMKDRYDYTETKIAAKLGVVQVTVSKYLNGRYSKDVGEIKSRIVKHNLNTHIIEGIRNGRDAKDISGMIDDLCAELAKA